MRVNMNHCAYIRRIRVSFNSCLVKDNSYKKNQCKYMNWFLQIDGALKKGLHDSKTKETTQKVMCIHFYL